MQKLSQPFIKRLGILSEFFFYCLSDLINAPLSVYLHPDKAPERVQFDITDLRSAEKDLGDPVKQPPVLPFDLDQLLFVFFIREQTVPLGI